MLTRCQAPVTSRRSATFPPLLSGGRRRPWAAGLQASGGEAGRPVCDTASGTSETKQRKHVGRWIAVSIVGVVVLALLAAIGWYFLRINPSVQQVETIETAFPEESLRPTAQATEAGAPVNVLLLGSDSRAQDGSLLTGL